MTGSSAAEGSLRTIQHSTWKRELQLDRSSKANALCPALIESLFIAISDAYADETRLLILSGKGKNFCAGFDRSDEGELGREEIIRRTLKIEAVLQLLWHAPFVTIARAQGAAMGAGADLVASCDYRLAEPGSRFAFPGFQAFGVTLGTRRLAELVGGSVAFDIVLQQRQLCAESALSAGLVTHVQSHKEIDKTITFLETNIANVRKNSITVLKEAVRNAQGTPTADLERVARSIMLTGRP